MNTRVISLPALVDTKHILEQSFFSYQPYGVGFGSMDVMRGCFDFGSSGSIDGFTLRSLRS